MSTDMDPSAVWNAKVTGLVPTSASYSYEVSAPEGVYSAADEAVAVEMVRKRRLDHRLMGSPRDERYYSIKATRSLWIAFEDDSEFTGAAEVIEVPDEPLSAEDEIENARRLAVDKARHRATIAWFAERLRSDSSNGSEQ